MNINLSYLSWVLIFWFWDKSIKFLFMGVCMPYHVCGGSCDNVLELVFSFSCAGPRDLTQVLRCGGQVHLTLSWIISIKHFFLWLKKFSFTACPCFLIHSLGLFYSLINKHYLRIHKHFNSFKNYTINVKERHFYLYYLWTSLHDFRNMISGVHEES